MRVGMARGERTRGHVVEVAARLFREHGFDGIGVADVMREAGLTHGGFYRHFASKDVLMAEAAGAAFEQQAERLARTPAIVDLLASYLSTDSIEDRGSGCPMAGLAGDAARRSDELRGVFARGVETTLEILEEGLRTSGPPATEARRALAVNLLAKLVGAVVLARAVPAGDALAREIIETSLAGALADAAPGA